MKQLLIYLFATIFLTGCFGGSDDDPITGVTIHDYEDITVPITWSGDHKITGDLYINSTLTLSKCTRIMVESGELIVSNGGAIISNGTADCPVMITSAKATPAPGDWKSLSIYAKASNNSLLTHTHIKYAGDQYGGIWVEDGATLGLQDVVIESIKDSGLYFSTGAVFTTLNNITINKIDGYPIKIGAKSVHHLSNITTSEVTNNTVYVFEDTLTVDTTWPALSIPYEIETLTTNKKLTISGDTTLLITPDRELNVQDGGSIVFDGTAEKPIVVKSSKASPASGDWRSINIYASADNGNHIHHTTIMHGGSEGYGQIWIEDGATIMLDHTTLSDGKTCDIHKAGTLTEGSNNSFQLCEL